MCAAHRARVSNFIAPLRQHSRAIPMPTGRAAPTLDVRRPGSVCFWATRWCHGRPNASPSSLGRAWRLSTGVWPTSRQNVVGFVIFLASCCTRCPRRQSCTATTSRPSTCPRILCIRVAHVPARHQLADIMTKGLPTTLFEDFRSRLCIVDDARTTGGVKVADHLSSRGCCLVC
jgi:hypothetical protein